jgi:hypothetical protein
MGQKSWAAASAIGEHDDQWISLRRFEARIVYKSNDRCPLFNCEYAVRNPDFTAALPLT